MTGIEIGEYMPVLVMDIVDGDVEFLTLRVTVLFHGKAVVLVEHGLTDLAAVRLSDFDFPGHHWDMGWSGKADQTLAALWPASRRAVASATSLASTSGGTWA